jgi:hypothetical protein
MSVAIARRRAEPAMAVLVAAACLLGDEVIHTVVIAPHFREWWATGTFFLVVSVVEGALAAALIVAPSRRLARAVVGVSLGTIAVWAWSRTVGVPVGPYGGTSESVGKPDVVATSFELATAIALLPLARRPRAGARPSVAAVRGRPITIIAIIALLTAYGSAGAGRYEPHAAHRPVVPITPADLR